ncbi:MAG: HypC/HybG/HupF family hydrogenase formation chaperone [Tepidimonas sp.]|uniref:HypC/HybG/HupF family hydrogenase formation chaperone n=1 Tax=Tepidimonas sp. TaxID=2002775 RepID=UPI00298F0AC2|nr:HypC/HybG/HupF family hydrogenase formation chaperone [Tepidimonas sp.]MCS6811791.1 HypC/HybG/HupF family hydrogenase formation chaperone [Tepidimonas sp.]MDW8335430.1 HypC/HybG/HupF family hydrogenase formation chaperone [Tepidimonas sp.]
MCLAVPARLIARHDDETGTVELGAARQRVSLALVPEARVGDHVIVHVGFALGVLDEQEAARTLALLRGQDDDALGG